MSAPPNVRNDYLNEVLAQQAQVEQDLKRQAPPAPAAAPPARAPVPGKDAVAFKKARHDVDEDHEEAPPGAPSTQAIAYRITGWWRWKTVVVPPNVYVVHTRRGHTEPITLGLGTSFSFDPVTDAFLLIPASM